MRLLSVTLIILFAHVVYNAKCPGKLGISCKISEQCDQDESERCYRDLDGTPNEKLFYCCRMMCPHTKMIMFHTVIGDTFLHKMNDTLKKELYYKNANSSIACPYPYSYATIEIDKVLPVGFSVDSAAPSNCKTNRDCGEGFYCGSSVNPSFGDNVLDESYEGRAMQFCYKDPNFGEKFRVSFVPSRIGLPLCNKDLECLGRDAICYQYGQHSLNDLQNLKWRGVCVKAFLCDNAVGSNKSVAIYTRNGTYCTNEDDCSGIQDEVYHPQCVSLGDANTANGSLCCFTPRMCEHGTARTPRVACSSSADCNNATTGPWNSWCDQKGYCCHDTNGTVQHLCPDGATLMFNEPKCKGKCNNGICINGRCCPEMIIENGVATTLQKWEYITNMPCDPRKPVAAHLQYSFCSPDGVVIVIGTDNVKEFWQGVTNPCRRHADCGEWGLCIKGNTTSACDRIPPIIWPKYESNWTEVIVPCILISLVLTILCFLRFGCIVLMEHYFDFYI